MHLESRRHLHRSCGLCGGESRMGVNLRERDAALRLEFSGLECRSLLMQPEVVKVHMPPAAGELVDNANGYLLVLLFGEVDDDGGQILGIDSAGCEEDFAAFVQEFHTRLFLRSPTHQHAAPGVRDLEGNRCQHPDRGVKQLLETTDPKFSGVPRILPIAIDAFRIDRPLHGLLGECIASSGPVLQCPRFKVEVERLPILTHRHHPGPARRLIGRVHGPDRSHHPDPQQTRHHSTEATPPS